MSISPYEQWVGHRFSHDQLNQWLEERLGHEFFSSDRGMEKRRRDIQTLFNSLRYWDGQDNQKRPFFITIAGSNGKGETSLILNNIFNAHGIKTALFTSPHILSLTERMCFNGRPIFPDELLNIFKKNEGLVLKLSFFEYLFYCFLDIAFSKKPEVIILEVGLGGRLDAVNFMDSNLVGLTSISRDHIEFLGTKLKDILREKLGVTRSHYPLISTIKQDFLIQYAKDYCQKHEIPFEQLYCSKDSSFKERNSRLAFELYKKYCSIHNLLCKQSFKSFDESIEKVSFGRGQEVTSFMGRFTLVGAHNIDGLRELVKWYRFSNSADQPFLFDRVVAGFSRKSSKDLEGCLRVLLGASSISKRFDFCSFFHLRATSPHLLKEELKKLIPLYTEKRIRYYKDLNYLFKTFKVKHRKDEKARNDEKVLVLGSYYFVGEFLKTFYCFKP